MKQEENIETSALKVEFITRYQNRGHEVLLPRYLGLKNLFIDHYGTDKMAGASRTADIGVLFVFAVDNYEDWGQRYEKIYGMDWLKEQDSKVPAADREFVKLVREFNVAAKHNADLAGWPARKIAESILSYMEEYYTINWQTGCSIEEDMLDCLMFADGVCQ